ncbi:MAG: XRE family transcriptional regulator [Micromonosporaceae bacterium]|nr:XRE family transcriptional regulator [Micromonosporaceae bacterium]
MCGLTYQAAAVLLTKLGEADLARIAAQRGLDAARRSGNTVVIGSLSRSVTHALLAAGRHREAKHQAIDAAGLLERGLGGASPTYLSVYGTLLLAGAMAAARDGDRGTVRDLLAKADESARRIGRDANHLWTAFGPTNVMIHRVATAVALGDVQVAVDLGPRVDTAGLPKERRVRHMLETAQALTACDRTDEAVTTVLQAERVAPEQVRNHVLSRRLVHSWMTRGRGKPDPQLAALAQRVRVAA